MKRWKPIVAAIGVGLTLTASGPAQKADAIRDVALTASMELCVGYNTSEDPIEFAPITDVAVDRLRRMYVLQPTVRAVTVIGQDGTPLQTLDLDVTERQGNVVGTSIGIRGDSLWFLDRQAARIRWYSNGTLVGETPPIIVQWRDSVGTTNRLGGPLADGHYYGVPALISAVVIRGLATKAPFLRIDRMGVVQDTITWVNVHSHLTMAVEASVSNGSGPVYMSPIISDAPLVEVSPAGDAFVIVDRRVPSTNRRHDISVYKVALSGDTLAEAGVPYEPRLLTTAHFSKLVQERLSGMRASQSTVDSASLVNAMWKPRYVPEVDRLIVGLEGGVWMRLHPERHSGETDNQWIILDAAMTRIASVQLPRGLKVLAASGENVWGVLNSTVGGPLVCRYQLQDPGRDGESI